VDVIGDDVPRTPPRAEGAVDSMDAGKPTEAESMPEAPDGGSGETGSGDSTVSSKMAWTPEKWDALRSPIRMELLALVEAEQPCTISDLARLTGRRTPSLYRHMQILVDAQLLIPAGTRPSKRRPEHLYRVSRSIVNFRRIVSDDDEAAENFVALIEATLRAVARGFREYFERRRQLPVGERPQARFMSRHEVTWIDEARAKRLNEIGRALSEIVDEGRREKTGELLQIDLMAWQRPDRMLEEDEDAGGT
jgi:predicted transcriptional regulator